MKSADVHYQSISHADMLALALAVYPKVHANRQHVDCHGLSKRTRVDAYLGGGPQSRAGNLR